MAYNGTTELISGITQKNGGTFPLVDASAVRVDDNTRLDAKLGNMSEATSSKVSTVTYDANDKKLTKTINGSTTDIVSVNTLMEAMGGIITNEQIDALFE